MYESYLTNGKQLSFEKAQVMAIINITPDSFYDGGKFSTVDDIIKDVENKISEGASIIDLGAMSTRPGAEIISEEDEKERLRVPLMEIRNHFPNIFISVDTYRASVAEFAINLGADIINDISGGDMDNNMIETVAKHNIPYILMHMQGTPQTMQNNPHYHDVVADITTFFKEKIGICEHHSFDKLILDLGFGFGKNTDHNYKLLKELTHFIEFGYPILAGISRKSMINKVLHTSPVTALNGTTVLNTLALNNGAKILRVHDVKEAQQAIELFEVYKNS